MLEEPAAAPTGPESPERRLRRPVMTLALAAVNLLLWVATVAFPGAGSLSSWLAFQPDPAQYGILLVFGAKENALIHGGEYWRLVAPIFLHWGIAHLALNNLSLLVLGSTVERIFGPARLLVLYLFSGICGSIASYEFSPALSVGASGAIFGLAGVIMVFTLRYRERLSPRFRDEVRTVLVPLVFLQLGLGFVVPGLDATAHVGGFLGGCVLAGLVESWRAGEDALARERLPVGIALITGALLLGYTGYSAAVSVGRALPLRNAAARGQQAFAVDYLQRLIEQRPDLVAPRAKLAQLLAQRGDFAGAATHLRELLRRDPGRQEYRVDLAEVLGRAGRWDEAVVVWNELVQRAPDDLQVQFQRAVALAQAKRPEAADAYREILRRRPDDPTVLNNLAYLYIDTLNARYAEAIRMAERAVKLRPNEGIFWDTLAWGYYKTGQLGRAEEAQRRAVALSSDHPEVRSHMGAIYEARGNPDAAVAEYRAALKLDPVFGPARERLRRLERLPDKKD